MSQARQEVPEVVVEVGAELQSQLQVGLGEAAVEEEAGTPCWVGVGLWWCVVM